MGADSTNDSAFEPTEHLSWGDLAVDIPKKPTVLSVHLKASKIGPIPERYYIVQLDGLLLTCARCCHPSLFAEPRE